MNGDSAGVPPSLSTYQDEGAFEFDRYSHTSDQTHLSLAPIQNEEQYHEIIMNYYSIQETASYIRSHPEWKRVTLQFPDTLVSDSSIVAQLLGRKLQLVQETTENSHGSENFHDNEQPCGCKDQSHKRHKDTNNCSAYEQNCESSDQKRSCGSCGCGGDNSRAQKEDFSQSVWVLADTSYSPCCVDEVAAQHVKGDVVIHYGDACLNPVEGVPVIYVFGKPAVNTYDIICQFRQRFEDKNAKIMLMGEAPYSYILASVYETLLPEFPNLRYGDILQHSFPQATIIGYSPVSSDHQLLNRSFLLNQQDIEEHDNEEDLEVILSNYDLLHIGFPEAPRLLKLTTSFQSVTIWHSNSLTRGPFPSLMRRYRYMQMARSSGTIGLLVNTLSLAHTKLLLNHLKAKITEAGKKHYMFVVGKPNVAKLANFDLIDLWCILGCDHQGIIVDQTNEYFKPIVTPFELLLSLNRELMWTGKWETDFKALLVREQQQEQDDEEDEKEEEEDDDDVPQFDPVTGQFTSTSQPLRRPQHLEISAESAPQDSSDALVKKFSSAVAIKGTVSTAAAQLQNRHWTGLGSDYQETDADGAVVEEGAKGIARGYDVSK